MIFRTVSINSAGTEQLGVRLGLKLKGGEVIELVSDLGGGKTTFVRGLSRGAKSPDHVSSPTFKISNIYKAGHLELHHFDFYRLSDAGIIGNELAEVIEQPNTVTIIEWGAVIQDVLPKDRVTVNIKLTDANARLFEIKYPPSLAYMVEGV